MANDTSEPVGVYFDAAGNEISASFFNDKNMALLTNKSGGSVESYDVVVLDTGTNSAFTTNTTAGAYKRIGVVPQNVTSSPPAAATKTIANDEAGWVQVSGVATAQYDGGAISRGEYMQLSSTAKKLDGTGTVQGATTTIPAGTVALALEANASTSGTVKVLLIGLVAGTEPEYPQTAFMFHGASRVTAGGALALTADDTQVMGLWYSQTGAAQNDAWEQAFVLAAGTYTLYVNGRLGGAAGIQTLSIDGVALGTTLDWYAASPALNTVKSIGSIVIASGGRHVLSCVMATKNASSSGYDAAITILWFVPSDYTEG